MTVMVNRIGGLSSSAAYNWMYAANARVNLTSFSANNSSNPAVLLSADKQLQADMLNNDLAFKAREKQHEALKKLQSAEIKRSFSTFA